MFGSDFKELLEVWETEHPYTLIEKMVATYDGIVIYTTVPGKTYRWDHKAKKLIEVEDWRSHNA